MRDDEALPLIRQLERMGYAVAERAAVVSLIEGLEESFSRPGGELEAAYANGQFEAAEQLRALFALPREDEDPA